MTDLPVAWRWMHVNDASNKWNYRDTPFLTHNEYVIVEPLYSTPAVAPGQGGTP